MAANDLTTLAFVQTYMQDDGAALAAALPPLITAVSAYIENYTGQNLVQADYDEFYNGNGNNRLILKQGPVTAVNSVNVCGVPLVAATPGNCNPGYLFDKYGITYRGWVFPKTVGNIEVSYTAGYATIPLDLQQAVAMTCNLLYKRMQNADKSSISMMGDQTTAFVSTEISPLVKSIINLYKPMFVVLH